MNVSETTVKLAGTPLSITLVVPVKAWPKMPPVWPTLARLRAASYNEKRTGFEPNRKERMQ